MVPDERALMVPGWIDGPGGTVSAEQGGRSATRLCAPNEIDYSRAGGGLPLGWLWSVSAAGGE